MKIAVVCSREDFYYDIHALVKSFYPDSELVLMTETEEAEKAAGCEARISVKIPHYDAEAGERPEAKNQLKRELYRQLSADTGLELPWGTLSGIRPTKIAMKAMREGKHEDEIYRYMAETYLTSREKISLAMTVAGREKALLDTLKPGWDLYVGIPFCPSICSYCTFSSSPIGLWASSLDDYLAALEKELDAAVRWAAGRDDYPLHTIYIGGGTPTSLDPAHLDRLLAMICGRFDAEAVSEFTVEAGRPDTVTPEKLKVLRSYPVTRISVNPQTMNDRTLEIIGRRHTAAQTEAAFAMARRAGFDNINMDMILGLPNEELPEVTATLDRIRALGPESLTVHSLAMKRASRLTTAWEQYRSLSFHNSEQVMTLSRRAAEAMGMAPYYLYRQKNMKGNLENVGYAVPGRECLYNILIMEEFDSIMACGAGASTKAVTRAGTIRRVVNPKDVRTYLTHIDDLIEKKHEAGLWTF